jgi:hypothetical protein
MARISLSALVTDIRGSVGPVVFSKWKGTNTARSRVRPGNPRTLSQRLARTFVYAVSRAWARQTEDYKASFNAAASGSGYSGFNLFVRRLKDYAVNFRDFRTTLAAAAAPGADTITVAASEPMSSPGYLETLGFHPGARFRVAAQAQDYTVTDVDHAANTVTFAPGLVAAADAGDPVITWGVESPAGDPWTPLAA